MRENGIVVRPFEFLNILEYSSHIRLNEHGTVYVEGHIHKDREAEYLQMLTEQTWVEVVVTGEDGTEEILFTGVVSEGCIVSVNGLKTLCLRLQTGSSLMDMNTHFRTYQDGSITCGEIINEIIREYPYHGMIIAQDSVTGRFLCQYNETDWEFIKRLAAYHHMILAANTLGKGVKFYFGLAEGKAEGEICTKEYRVRRNDDRIVFEVLSRELYRLGDCIALNGMLLYVVGVDSDRRGSELYHCYSLCRYRDIRIEPWHNALLRGVSLRASVVGVERDCVQIRFNDVENIEGSVLCWFPFMTVYSSSNGSGWYFMPEPGDCVRVYFPDEKEEHACVASSVHLDSEDKEERVNPSYKSIMNKQKKEILFTPDSILLTNNAGISIELSDREGIKLISDKDIIIESEGSIRIASTSSNVDIFSSEGISMQQGGARMVLSDSMMMKGTKVKLD